VNPPSFAGAREVPRCCGGEPSARASSSRVGASKTAAPLSSSSAEMLKHLDGTTQSSTYRTELRHIAHRQKRFSETHQGALPKTTMSRNERSHKSGNPLRTLTCDRCSAARIPARTAAHQTSPPLDDLAKPVGSVQAGPARYWRSNDRRFGLIGDHANGLRRLSSTSSRRPAASFCTRSAGSITSCSRMTSR